MIVLGLHAAASRAPSPRSGKPTSNEKCKQGGNHAQPSPYPDRRLGAAALAGPAICAQNFPRKAIQMIVAFPAGGSTDIGARIVAASAEKEFGQPVVVVNKAGAGGQLGFTEAARARPDGYTLCFLNLPGINTIIARSRAQGGVRHRQLRAGHQPGARSRPGLGQGRQPLQDLRRPIEAAKKNPGKISACTTGILSDDHLAILMTHEAAKVEFRIVHFDGGAQQITGVLGGHVDVAFDNVGGVFKRVRSGELRGLAVHRQRALEVPARGADRQGARLSRPSSRPRRAASASRRARRPTSSRRSRPAS